MLSNEGIHLQWTGIHPSVGRRLRHSTGIPVDSASYWMVSCLNQAIRRVGASHGSTLSAAVGVANALRVCRICSSRRCITIPCTQNSTRGIVQDRTAGLASLVEGFILKLQLASLQVVVWWPPILLPGQPALCSSVMAFAPSSTQAWSTRTNVPALNTPSTGSTRGLNH